MHSFTLIFRNSFIFIAMKLQYFSTTGWVFSLKKLIIIDLNYREKWLEMFYSWSSMIVHHNNIMSKKSHIISAGLYYVWVWKTDLPNIIEHRLYISHHHHHEHVDLPLETGLRRLLYGFWYHTRFSYRIIPTNMTTSHIQCQVTVLHSHIHTHIQDSVFVVSSTRPILYEHTCTRRDMHLHTDIVLDIHTHAHTDTSADPHIDTHTLPLFCRNRGPASRVAVVRR